MKGRNKKGSVLDVIFIIIALLVFSMSILIGYKLIDSFDDKIQTMSVFASDGNVDSRASSTKLTGYFPGVIDGSFLFLTIGLAIVAFVLAALVRIHPIFIPFYLIALIFVIILSGVYSNVFQEISADPEMSDLANNLSFTKNIMTYLPFFVGIFGILLMVVMYKTWKVDQ